MILSVPFLASRIEQFDPKVVRDGFGIEAALFDRRDIEDPTSWARTCANIRMIAERFRPPSFTFHFPVNDCDYVECPLMRDRLFEAIDMATAVGLDGIVLHSNRVLSTDDWLQRDFGRERARFVDFISTLRDRVRGGPLWIGLENMPIHGNDAHELDPLLLFPDDFEGLCGDNIGITWDICHYSYTVHVANELLNGRLADRQDYPRVESASWYDFERLLPHIVHWHFSGFLGIASRSAGTICTEGVVPWASTVAEDVYREAFTRMSSAVEVKAATLEIREKDYANRKLLFQVAKWCRQAAS